MDRRSHQNNPRGNPRPFDHGAEADRAYKQIHCRDGQISGLEEYRGAFQEERTKFCHSMRKQKDKVKRLEELLNYRNSGLHKENKKLVDTIVEREAEISRLNGNIENAECQHERQLEDTVALYETQQQKLSDQHNEANLVTLNLLQRREEQLRQCEDKFTKSLAEHTLTWESERQEMEMKLKEVEKKKKYQASRNKTLQTEFQQMEDRLKRQEDKFSKDLADKSRTWETEKQQMETTLNEVTREKNDMAKETLTLETEFKQVEAKLEQVEKEKDRLAENNLGWETDVKQLKGQVREQEEKFAKDLAQNQESWESRVHSVETKLKEVTLEKDDLDQKHQSEMKEVQAKLKMVRDEKKDSAKKNQRMELDLKLKKRLVQLENDLEEQKKKFSKDLAEKQLHWEQFVQRKETDVKQLENQLEEQKKKFSRDLAQNQKSWESRIHSVETTLQEVTLEKDDLDQKHQRMETKLRLTETQVEEQSDELAQSRLSWATAEQKMEEEKELLEDLCLDMKNKSRGFFSRRRGDAEDRDVALQKMISKMQEKEMRKKAKDARDTSSEEMEEASGDSAPAGQQ